jgi:hypothetical protein
LARTVLPSQCIVELGSWFGRSAILLGGGSAVGNGAPVYAVDLFRPAGFAKEVLEQRAGQAAQDFWGAFHQNIIEAGLAHKVTAIRGNTPELGLRWDGPPVGLLFVDADHSYEGVRSDWTNWRARLARSAKVAFHDYQNPSFEGVTRFINEIIRSRQLRCIEQHDSVLVGEVVDGRPGG